jgi:hypothetical protein
VSGIAARNGGFHVVPYTEVNKGHAEEGKGIDFTPFFIKYSISLPSTHHPSTLQSTSFDHKGKLSAASIDSLLLKAKTNMLLFVSNKFVRYHFSHIFCVSLARP